MADLFNAEWQQACVPAGQNWQRFNKAVVPDNDSHMLGSIADATVSSVALMGS